MSLIQNLNPLKVRLNRINKVLSERAIRYNLLIDQKDKIIHEINELTSKEKVLHDVCLLLQDASTFSRLKMKKDIETVVSNSLQEIFSDPTLGFVIEYKSAHNKVTADFFLTKIIDGNNVKLDILNECGGGVADVVALSIRIVLLMYHSKKVSKILLLDEACTSISNFSGEVLNNLGKWLKTISERFDIQIILVTQKQELAAFANKSFKVEIGNEGYSIVSEE